ncbi:MAG: hypothetical protein GPOALKHO_000795 [Sodalis sp.]|nr:MAG: hypothetical protein GPOALKHO_000795 [Sodalis sp.]
METGKVKWFNNAKGFDLPENDGEDILRTIQRSRGTVIGR